jgi:hypothetical protein
MDIMNSFQGRVAPLPAQAAGWAKPSRSNWDVLAQRSH